MQRMDPDTGCLWLEGIATPLEPRMTYAEFTFHPAATVMQEVRSERTCNQRVHQFPDGEFEGSRVWGTASFTNGELGSLWLQILSEESEERYERTEPRLLALHERWLRQVLGVEGRKYPWGLVWPRFNINAGWHDIAIFFS